MGVIVAYLYIAARGLQTLRLITNIPDKYNSRQFQLMKTQLCFKYYSSLMQITLNKNIVRKRIISQSHILSYSMYINWLANHLLSKLIDNSFKFKSKFLYGISAVVEQRQG